MRESPFQESFSPVQKSESELRQELLSELEETKRALRHAGKLATLGELCAGLAHELNNPLSIIRGSTELAAYSLNRESTSEAVKLEEMRRNLQRIDHASERMVKIVKDVLRFSRRTPTLKTSFSLGASLREAIEQAEALFVRSSIRIQIEPGPRDVTCRGDQSAISQVWMNLLVNAKDAIASSGNRENGLIQVSVRGLSATKVRITFQDNGCGMDQETQDKVFQPFFTTKEVGKGSGLGLSISHGIIEEHAGAIFCSSAVGQGTTLHVVLPIARA